MAGFLPQKGKIMKVQRIIKAAIGATLDRRLVNNAAKKSDKNVSDMFVKRLEAISGPSASNYKDRLTSWHLAYLNNLERVKKIDEMNEPFKKKSPLVEFFKNLFKLK